MEKREKNMPRKLTEDEIQQQKDYMYQKGIALIKEKGVMNITLEDITRSSQMAKGSFYRYYKTKELFLYEIIKRNESYFYSKFISETDIRKSFEMYFLSDDFLFAYLIPEDLDYLLRRLPKEFQEKEKNKSESNFLVVSQKLGFQMTQENYGTLSYLMDGLQTILRSPGNYGESGRKRASKIMVNAISAFFMEEMK